MNDTSLTEQGIFGGFLPEIAGLPVVSLPEFSRVNIGDNYWISLKKIGNSIVYIDTEGCLQNLNLELFNEAVDSFCLVSGVEKPYTQIQNLARVTGRLPFLTLKKQVMFLMEHRKEMIGMVLIQEPSWLQPFINHGLRLYNSLFKVITVENHADAMAETLKLLAENRARIPGTPAVRPEIFPRFADVLFKPEWEYVNPQGCRFQIGIIPGKLYYLRLCGSIQNPRDIVQGGALLEKVLVENQLFGVPFILVNYSELSAIKSLRLRQQFAKEASRINALTRNEHSTQIAIRPDRLNRIAIEWIGPFLKQKILVVESVTKAFEIVAASSTPPPVPDRKRDILVSTADLEELSEAFRVLQLHAGEDFPQGIFVSPDNPLAYLVECLELIRSDIQHMVDHERKLQEQLHQSQKMESVGRLAGGVAHDFNNMLSVIQGNIELVLEQVDPASPLQEELEEIRRAAKKSADLTRQLLAFARRQTVAPRALDLNHTVEGMIAMLRRLMGEDIQIEWKPAGNLWPVLIDPGQVDQTLANLCVNARDAIADMGQVIIATRNQNVQEPAGEIEPGDYVVLSVADTGSGMDDETLSHLFEPFYTTKALGQGTGLGLSMIYGIARQNNGHIRVQSAPGEGSIFEMFLPRYTGPNHVGDATVLPVRPTSTRGRETVLLVEDEESILKLAQRVLAKQGYRVLAAASPAQALELAQNHPGPIELLVTDVVMPGMNGRDLAVAIQELYPDIKRLFISGYTREIITHEGILEPGMHFLHKPFSSSDLASSVRTTLDAP